MFGEIYIRCLCACGCSGKSVLEAGVAPDRCWTCEHGDNPCKAWVPEDEALDNLNALRLSDEDHAIAVDALTLLYRPAPPVDREHEAQLLALLGRA